MIINYDLPTIPKEYIHRVGRTARAGRRGQAVSLITPTDLHLLKEIETTIGRQLQQREVDGECGAQCNNIKCGGWRVYMICFESSTLENEAVS